MGAGLDHVRLGHDINQYARALGLGADSVGKNGLTPVGLLYSWFAQTLEMAPGQARLQNSATLIGTVVKNRLGWSRLQHLQVYPIIWYGAGQTAISGTSTYKG